MHTDRSVSQITEAEFAENWERIKSDAYWRITSGKFYKIMVKEDDDDDSGESFVLPFIPNEEQLQVLNNLWYRNVIPKARQRGITTLICIIWLDHALFVENQRCGIVAHRDKSAKAIFRDKVKFAYDNLPEFMRQMFPLKASNAEEILFEHNNSSVQVSTSLRSGTTHRLHISEFAYICAKFPERAVEVMTGSIPSVPLNGITVIESTGMGSEGDFARISYRAKELKDARKKLTKRDYRLHFFPWWTAQEYRMEPEGVDISPKDNEYFDRIEAENGIELDQEQCAWYVSTRDNDYAGREELMWREFPSTFAEVFEQSKEGCWYTKEMTAMRITGRIKTLPTVLGSSCWSFWDIGNTDGTAIWVIQRIGHEFRCIRFYEAWGEPYAHATAWLQSLGLTFECHYLPHDAEHVRQGKTDNVSPRQMLEELLPGARFETVDRIDDVTWGIQQTRDIMPQIWIDENECKEGIAHLDGYKKKWNSTQQRYIDVPEKADGHSEAADALRQFGQAYASGKLNVRISSKPKKARNWRTA